MFEEAVDRFLDVHADDAARARWRDQGFVDRETWLAAGEAGLLGCSLPEEYGGSGGDFRYDALLMERLGLKQALHFAIPLHTTVVAPYIAAYASEDLRKRLLPGAISGEKLMAVAMTEPGAGSDLQGMKSTAVRDGDHYVINGQKTFISNGYGCDVVIVAAKTDATAGARGISLFVVEVDKVEGFQRGRLLDKLGQEGRDTTELFFSDMRVPVENLLGGVEGQGFRMLMEMLPKERLVIAWQAMGMIESALALTVDYTRERKAFGKSLFEQQNTQFKLADCKTRATVAKTFLYHCTEKLVHGQLDAATASMAKLFVTEAQAFIIDECLQLFGGYGYMLEYPISEMYKDARAYRIYGGSSEIMKMLIARSI
ncbi:acyl-CoA dehydrogenase family protein [Novosphingobium sp. KCTC 2891]|uniref:acyl-CoA dehydrogenase family protein n=1 Tax=Novosphingobium sp. KCTC 2891 TaxID=2989730 RepID=UPI0022223255|nr:acyl-CoA dehydrogenase family protein [Novosphingobium sp. KCTC 2891]MCW1384897.1 acyl-CoA dehydrogenase family protein [Novosphingobium sp. KCTC 2891]